MTKIARMTPTIPRGTIIGKRTGGPRLSEAEHFQKCEACGGWFDMRDLGAVLDHEEPLPHPAQGQPQWCRAIPWRWPLFVKGAISCPETLSNVRTRWTRPCRRKF
jgi:hypothetical protein